MIKLIALVFWVAVVAALAVEIAPLLLPIWVILTGFSMLKRVLR